MSKALLKCVPNPNPCLYMCCVLPSHGYLYLACVNMYIHMELYMYINNVPLCISIYLRFCMLAKWSKYGQWHKHLQICRSLMIPMQPFCLVMWANSHWRWSNWSAGTKVIKRNVSVTFLCLWCQWWDSQHTLVLYLGGDHRRGGHICCGHPLTFTSYQI